MPTAAACGQGKADRLCECHVVAQVANVVQPTFACAARNRGQPLAVHGWIYGLGDGLLRDLGVTVGHAAADRTPV